MAAMTSKVAVVLHGFVRQLGPQQTGRARTCLPAFPRVAQSSSASCSSQKFRVTATLRLISRPGARKLRMRAMSGEQMTIRSVPVQVAKELMEAGHTYLDVRTPEEFSAGHVEGAVNIPFMYRQNGGMTMNPEFLEQVKKVFDAQDEMVVACQSGKRSFMAVTELQNAGYSCVTDMGGGFGAWVESGLPVSKA